MWLKFDYNFLDYYIGTNVVLMPYLCSFKKIKYFNTFLDKINYKP